MEHLSVYIIMRVPRKCSCERPLSYMKHASQPLNSSNLAFGFLDQIITSGPESLLGIDKFDFLGCSWPFRTTNPMRIATPDRLSDERSITKSGSRSISRKHIYTSLT